MNLHAAHFTLTAIVGLQILLRVHRERKAHHQRGSMRGDWALKLCGFTQALVFRIQSLSEVMGVICGTWASSGMDLGKDRLWSSARGDLGL